METDEGAESVAESYTVSLTSEPSFWRPEFTGSGRDPTRVSKYKFFFWSISAFDTDTGEFALTTPELAPRCSLNVFVSIFGTTSPRTLSEERCSTPNTVSFVLWEGLPSDTTSPSFDLGGNVAVDGVCSFTADTRWALAVASFSSVTYGSQGRGV
jgi:hypothetical protein